MAKPSKILLVEDDPHDVELTLSALTENHLTNEIVVARPEEAQLVSLRETVSSEGFDDKRGLRRIMALWGSTNSLFYW